MMLKSMKALEDKNADKYPEAKDRILNKYTFGSTVLPETIRPFGYDYIELVGLCTDICVISNVMVVKAFYPEETVKVISPDTDAEKAATLEQEVNIRIVLQNDKPSLTIYEKEIDIMTKKKTVTKKINKGNINKHEKNMITDLGKIIVTILVAFVIFCILTLITKLFVYYKDLDIIPIIGDVRQPNRLEYVFNSHKPQIVFHAAAYKHVPLMEENPCEATLVNVDGSRNVADMCIKHNAEMMVMISTDKAVNPTNIMGCTKRLAEIYVQSLGSAITNGEIKGNTKFVTTRLF